MLLLLQNPESMLNAILCKSVVAVDGGDARNIVCSGCTVARLSPSAAPALASLPSFAAMFRWLPLLVVSSLALSLPRDPLAVLYRVCGSAAC